MASTPLFDAASSSMRSNERARVDRDGTTRTRRTARRRSRSVAVEDLGEDAGGRGLAGAAGPAEQVGVADAVRRAPRCAAR